MIRVPKDVTIDAERFIKLLETSDGNAIHDVMKSYFGPYWLEFKRYWLNSTDEMIDWVNFALAPHNAQNFVEYVFTKHPEVRKTIIADIDALENEKG